jgi:hypothetical protein
MDDFDDEELGAEGLPPEVVAEFISTFITHAHNAEAIYRRHYCDVVAGKVHNEFGTEGLCELMMAMDKRAEWISDILLEAPDLENIAFKKYGVYDGEIAKKARNTKALAEMNEKLWRLRRKYAKLIVDEIMGDINVN